MDEKQSIKVVAEKSEAYHKFLKNIHACIIEISSQWTGLSPDFMLVQSRPLLDDLTVLRTRIRKKHTLELAEARLKPWTGHSAICWISHSGSENAFITCQSESAMVLN